MVSIWWIVAAFVGGGFLGMMVIALMSMAGDLPKRSGELPDFDATRW